VVEDFICDYSWITKTFCAHCLEHEPDFDLGASVR